MFKEIAQGISNGFHNLITSSEDRDNERFDAAMVGVKSNMTVAESHKHAVKLAVTALKGQGFSPSKVERMIDGKLLQNLILNYADTVEHVKPLAEQYNKTVKAEEVFKKDILKAAKADPTDADLEEEREQRKFASMANALLKSLDLEPQKS